MVSALVEHGRLAPSQGSACAKLAELAIKLGELQLERDLLDLEIEREREPRRDEDNVVLRVKKP